MVKLYILISHGITRLNTMVIATLLQKVL